MELTLAILMVLGIFVGVAVVIGFAIVGAYTLCDQQVCRVERAKAVKEAVAIAKHQTKEHAPVA